MCLITGSVCHCAARRYQWLRRISPQKCSISVSSAGAGSNSKRMACSSSSVGTSSGRKRRRYSISTSECFCSSKNQTLMKAQKSLSSRLSRRNISVAGSAAHSVMAFILIVVACSSVSLDASKESQGMSLSMSQRTASSCLNSSGYSMLAWVSSPHFSRARALSVRQNALVAERVSGIDRKCPSKMRPIGAGAENPTESAGRAPHPGQLAAGLAKCAVDPARRPMLVQDKSSCRRALRRRRGRHDPARIKVIDAQARGTSGAKSAPIDCVGARMLPHRRARRGTPAGLLAAQLRRFALETSRALLLLPPSLVRSGALRSDIYPFAPDARQAGAAP